MRILALILAAALPIAASVPVAAQVAKPDRTRCKAGSDMVGYKDAKPGMHKLGEMPPAVQIKTVYREVDGCPTPVVVRKGIGGDPRTPTPAVDGAAKAIKLR